KIRRVAGETVTVKAPRRNSYNRHGFRVHPESTAYDGSTAQVIALPGCIAHYGGHGCAHNIVGIGKQPPGLWLQAEGAEVITGDKLSTCRASTLSNAIAPHNDGAITETCLHRSQFLKFGDIFLQGQVSLGGK